MDKKKGITGKRCSCGGKLHLGRKYEGRDEDGNPIMGKPVWVCLNPRCEEGKIFKEAD